jgi:hypothetical protein
MKKLSIAIPVFLLLFFASCLKDKPNVDFSGQGYIAEITTASTNGTPNAPSGGLDFFAGATLSATATDPDSVMFTVNIASDYPPTKDTKVTIAVNDQARVSYIADPSKVPYLAMPANAYKLTTTTGTIKAGNRLDTFWVVFTHANMDPTQSYMLPISITDASGITISGNLSTIYFHIVGNPLAGTYHWDFTRWNSSDTTTANTGTFTGHTTTFVPNSPTNVEVASGYYIGPRYEITFVNTGGVLSNFSVAFNSADVAQMVAGGVVITSGPTILIADPVHKIFRFQYQALVNGSSVRYVIDKYYP